MNEYENLFLQQLNLATYGCTLNQLGKKSLLEKYELLASVLMKSSDKSIVVKNLANFEILFNKTLFLSVIGATPRTEFLDYKNLKSLIEIMNNKFPEKSSIARLETLHNNIESLLKECGGTSLNTQSIENVSQALSTFGLEQTELSEEEANSIELEDELKDIADELFDGDEETDEDEEDEIGIEEDEDEDEDEETAGEEEQTDKEKKAEISKLFTALINQNVTVLANVLSGIYKSGFSAMPHAGLLVNNGSNSPLIKLRESIKEGTFNNMQTVPDEGTAFDFMIMQTICSKLPELSRYANVSDGKNAIPDIKELMNANMVCTALHLQFQSAHIDYCTGITSIRRWITETKVKDKSEFSDAEDWIKKKNHGRRRLCSFKDVRAWYEWCLRNIMVEALVKAGVVSLADMDKAIAVLSVLSKNIKNVIAVSDRAVGEQEEIKICTDSNIPVDEIINLLKGKLNIGNTNAIDVKQIANDNFSKNNVLTLSIVYDAKKANSSNLFAYEIINRLADAGSLPSWDNALLGKKEDGSYLFWQDFTGSAEPYKRNYTIYAGSRSGKGVMTSTLVASALCDRRHVFFTDGKPENGACLAEIAWAEGKEAYVFDGQACGKKPYQGYMENYTNGMRKPDEVAAYIEKLPKKLFANKAYFTREKQQKFLGVMRYLKSLQLCATIATMRAGNKLPMDDWQVWIFDEMTDMSNNEKAIIETFARYVRDKTGAKDISENDQSYYKIVFNKMKAEQIDKSSDKYDEGLDYIRQWTKWTSSIRYLASNLSTISIGKANMNLIFIFQEATWIAEARNITTIGKVVNTLKSTKIVGKNALANACGDYGEGPTQKTAWYTDIQNGNGLWAISNGADLRTSSVTLFKPYTVWTTPLNAAGTKDINGDMNDQKYLGAYIRSLLGRAGINPADILQEAYDYADSAVKQLGYADSIKEYIYDCSNFAVDNNDSSYAALHNEYTDGDGVKDEHEHERVSDRLDIGDEEPLDFGNIGTGNQKMSDEELLTTAEYIWSQCETDALGPEQKQIFIKMIVALLREWGW